MNELTKTICFVVTAVVLGLVAVLNAKLNQPGDGDDTQLIGTQFYPDFTSSESAKALEVAAVDEAGNVQRFSVEDRGGLWRIPSHYDYPAEAAARIAQTSASVIGIERQSQVGKRESDFERYGVVDPLSDSIEDPESAGQRITLKDENGDPLVDYIIGKQVEDDAPAANQDVFEQQSDAKDFYIRRADESQTFRVSLDVDLSTRFSDWIDPDLLRVSDADITRIAIDNYKIEEKGVGMFSRVTQLVKDQGDQLKISRTSPADPWSLKGLDEAKEELKTDRINEILGVLDEMKIVGVRPKFKYQGKQLLTPELTLVQLEELKGNPEQQSYAIAALQNDLTEKGFNFGGTAEKLELVSENGELEFGTSGGVLYRLHVGAEVSGDEKAIEIGGTSTASNDDTSESENESAESANDAPSAKPDENTSNRFLFVRVSFDESLLGDPPMEPTKPTEPTKPEGYVPASENPEGDAGSDENAEENPSAETDAETEKEDQRDEAFIAYDAAVEAFNAAKQQYEVDLSRYQQDVKSFEEKITQGKQRVDELNERFGDWFYVISASNLNLIQSQRTDLVEIKTPPKPPAGFGGESGAAADSTPPARKPDISFPSIPADTESKQPSNGESKEEATESQSEVEKEVEKEKEKKKPSDTSVTDTEKLESNENGDQAADKKEGSS